MQCPVSLILTDRTEQALTEIDVDKPRAVILDIDDK